MSVQIIQDRLESYQCKSELEERNALKEITQEIALMALSRADFFRVAEFHGGTALRILYGLQRFSEDLDFALLKPDPAFDLKHYLNTMTVEFETYGYDVKISDRTTLTKTVQKDFIKVDSLGKLIDLQYPFNRSHRKLKIKLEIDTNHPKGATTELKYQNFPLPFSVLAKDLPSSFAGKLHALLCRSYDKGRDWYDLIWYVTRKTPINYKLLKYALAQQGPWVGEKLIVDKDWVIDSLKNKIENLNWHEVRDDVKNLLRMHELPTLKLWEMEFFLDQLDKMENYLPN